MVLYTDGDSQELDHSEIIKHVKQAYKHLDFPHAHIQKKLAPTVDDMNSSVLARIVVEKVIGTTGS